MIIFDFKSGLTLAICRIKFTGYKNKYMPDIYSSILLDFAAPLLHKNDSKKILQFKLSFAEMVWNDCIAEELKLTLLSLSIKNAINVETKKNKQFQKFVSVLKANKKTHFYKYKNYLVNTEVKQKPDGSLSVVAQFVEPKQIIESNEKLLNDFLLTRPWK